MKRLVSPGITLIVPSFHHPPSWGYYDQSGRPFAIHYFIAEAPSTTDWYLVTQFDLSDGNPYNYYYGSPQVSESDVFPLYAQATASGDPSQQTPTGGEWFNYVGRALPVIKVLA